MSGLKRPLKKFVRKPGTVTADDVERLLVDHFGYRKSSKSGSHDVFHKEGSYPITVPKLKGRHVKRLYVKQLVKILGLEAQLEELQDE